MNNDFEICKHKWISIKNEYPKNGDRVLAITADGFIGTCDYVYHFNFDLTDPQSEYEVTHWMPLPKRPLHNV
jgi:hypothetical protein